MKTFNVITTIAMTVTLLAAVLSVAGIPFYGLYPAMAALWSLPLIPIFSRRYVKKVNSRIDGSQKKSFVALTILNAFIILVELWMAFVIVHDRVLGDCC
jgi:hypothetical protein